MDGGMDGRKRRVRYQMTHRPLKRRKEEGEETPRQRFRIDRQTDRQTDSETLDTGDKEPKNKTLLLRVGETRRDE
jgi:hypothetical protein